VILRQPGVLKKKNRASFFLGAPCSDEHRSKKVQSHKAITMSRHDSDEDEMEPSLSLIHSPDTSSPCRAEQFAQLALLQQQMARLTEQMNSRKRPAESQTSDALTQQTTNTGVSSIGKSTTYMSSNGAELTMGPKGAISAKHKHPRAIIVEKDKAAEKQRQIAIFASKVTNGDLELVAQLQQRFHALDKENRDKATAMLTPFVLVNGIKDAVLRQVFNTGGGRYILARDGPKDKDDNSSKTSRRNFSAFGNLEIEHLRRFMESKFIPW